MAEERPLRIAIFTDSFLPQVNGVVTSILTMSKRLARRGHTVLIFAPAHWRKIHFQHENIQLHWIPSIPARFYEDFRWVSPYDYTTYRALKKADVDIVHAMTPTIVGYLGMKYARRLNLPLVFSFHTLITDPSYYEHLFRRGLVQVSQEMIWDYCNHFTSAADLVVSPSETTKRVLEAHNRISRSLCISNGIETDLFDNSSSEELRQRYGLMGKTVLYIGRVAQEKSIDLLIRAFQILWKRYPEARLVIVGDGPDRVRLERMCDALPCREAVLFLGKIDREELLSSGIFGAVELFASCSRTETQGISVLEALVNRVPALVVDEGAVGDLIDNGVNGYILPSGDIEAISGVMIRLFDHPEELERLRSFPDSLLEPHYMENVIDTWEKSYRSLIADYAVGVLPEKAPISLHRTLAVFRSMSFAVPFKRRRNEC